MGHRRTRAHLIGNRNTTTRQPDHHDIVASKVRHVLRELFSCVDSVTEHALESTRCHQAAKGPKVRQGRSQTERVSVWNAGDFVCSDRMDRWGEPSPVTGHQQHSGHVRLRLRATQPATGRHGRRSFRIRRHAVARYSVYGFQPWKYSDRPNDSLSAERSTKWHGPASTAFRHTVTIVRNAASVKRTAAVVPLPCGEANRV